MKLKWIAVILLLPLVLVSCSKESSAPATADQAVQPALQEDTPPAADIASKEAEKVIVLFENEYLRVLRFDLEPNGELPAHEGNPRVVYSLGDYEIDWTAGEEAARQLSWAAGEAHGHDADIHAMKNIGETTASFLVFERLDTPLPSEFVHEEGLELPPGANVLLDNTSFHVVEISLAPGEEQTLHPGGWRAVYSLSDYAIEWQENDGVEQKSWSEGDVHWHEPAQHAAVNTGDTQARWLVIELKN